MALEAERLALAQVGHFEPSALGNILATLFRLRPSLRRAAILGSVQLQRAAQETGQHAKGNIARQCFRGDAVLPRAASSRKCTAAGQASPNTCKALFISGSKSEGFASA